jgi:hypothetical protein
MNIDLPDYDGGTDLTQYCKEVLVTLQTYGAAASIVLNQVDKWFLDSSGTSVDILGYAVDIGRGYICHDRTKRYSNLPKFFIDDTPLTSFEGEAAVELQCFDKWQLLSYIRVMNASPAVAAPAWAGTKTILEIITELIDATGIASVVLDSSDGYVDDPSYKPYYVAYINQPVSKIIVELLTLTNCYGRFENDGDLHIGERVETDDNKASFDIATPGHRWFTNTVHNPITKPNRIIVVDLSPTDSDTQTIEGKKVDQESVDALKRSLPNFSGFITRVMEDRNIPNNDYAKAQAEGILGAYQLSGPRGMLRTNLECRIELGDFVEVTDKRLVRRA